MAMMHFATCNMLSCITSVHLLLQVFFSPHENVFAFAVHNAIGSNACVTR